MISDISLKGLTGSDDILFPFCWELYILSFPEEERRGLDYHIAAMKRVQYHCDVILDSEEPIGLLFWWELNDFIFIEHFAISPAVRGRGYGGRILEWFISSCDRQIILEVEYPTDEICSRRIVFYERLGFVLNSHQYRQPSYRQIEGEYVDLLIMTYGRPITEEELHLFVVNEFPIIHFRGLDFKTKNLKIKK